MPRLPRSLLLAVILALASPAAHATILASQGAGFSGSEVGPGSLGQSVTTPAGGPWSGITFSLVEFATSAPYASGALFLLSAPYAGNVAALGPTTPGYLAETTTTSAGAWVFDDAVTLEANTQYFFLMASGVPTALRFGGDLYAGGIAYQTDSRGAYIPLPFFDLNFILQGTEALAPEPASALLLAPALLALLGTSRHRPA